MKIFTNYRRLFLAGISAMILLIMFTRPAISQTVLNNNLLRFGHGAENSVNTSGNLQQPFYYNTTLNLWRKLTYSTYPLDNSFGAGGDGTSEWNLNGYVIQNPAMTSQVIDLSGYITTSAPNGYGRIISTGIINIAGSNLEVINTYELGQDKSFIKITTSITNISPATVTNVRYWVGTRDDYVGGTDQPKKEKGNLVDGSFVKLTNATDRALALRISTADEGVLFYTNSSKGNNIINSCCSWTNVTNTNPQTSVIEITNDGSYGFYVRLNDLAPNTSDEFTWYYASGQLADLEEIIADVAAASGAISDITYTTATFKAKTSANGTGYWVVVPRGTQSPTEVQIKNGVDYGATDVVASGSGAMIANQDKLFYLTGLTAGTNYDLYFVSENATPAFSSIAKIQFSTVPYTIPELGTNAIQNIHLVSATSGGNITDDGGQPVLQRGVCWNTTGNPTIADNKTSDGSGTGSFESSITGINEGTTYYVRAYATNSVGTAYGSVVSFTTLSATLSGSTGGTVSIQNFPLYIATGAVIFGTSLDGAEVAIKNNFASSQDKLGIDALQNGVEGNITYSFNSGTGILTLSGTATASDYQALLRRVTYSNTAATPSLATRSIRISLSAGGAYQDVNVNMSIPATSLPSTVQSASFVANWNSVAGATSYYLDVATSPDFAVCLEEFNNKETGNQLSFDITNLSPVTTYYYRIRAAFTDGTGFNSTIGSATTIKSNQVITFDALDAKSYGDDSFLLSASSDSELPVALSSSNTAVATITGNTVNITGAGTTLITASQAGNEIYNPAENVTQLLTVNKATLAVAADPKTKSYGSDNPVLTFQYSGWKNNDDENDLTTEPSIVTTITQETDAGNYTGAITVSGAADENYDFIYTAADFEVTKATLTVTADPKTKIYGEENPVLTFQYDGWKNGDDADDLTTKPIALTTVDNTTGAGTYDDAITVSGATDENYDFNYVAGDFDVTKATLTVTADPKTKSYGSDNPVLTFEYNGWKNGDDEEDLTTKPIALTTVDNTTGAGTYDDAITVSGAADENYDFTYVAADFAVTKATLTVTADPKTKSYGSDNPVLTFQYNGWKNNDDEDDLTTKPSVVTTITQATDAGNYTGAITVSGAADENYDFTYTAADFEVTKATLTVTADPKTKIYGEENPVLTLQYDGWKNGDDADDLTIKPIALTTVDNTTCAGTYDDAITVSGAADENYDFTYVAADFAVTNATLTVTADPKTKSYGSDNPVLTFEYNGWKNGDDEEDLTTKPIALTTVDNTTGAGTYDDAITVSGAADENYDFTYVAADFAVTKATLTVTADPKTKSYGSDNPVLTFQYNGWKNNDDEDDLTTEPSVVTTITQETDAGNYTGAITVSGAADENYDFTYAAADFEVTKATLTVTADPKTKIYGEENPVLTFQYNGWKNDDDAGDLTTIPTANTHLYMNSHAGMYVGAITITGGVDENYEFIYNSADFEITRATLKISADPKTKVYGSENPQLTYRYDGWINEDDESVLTHKPTISTSVTEISPAGIYAGAIILSGATDEDYTFEYMPADFLITKSELTVKADNKNKVYGDANPGLTITFSGFRNNDDSSVLDLIPEIATDVDVLTGAGEYTITLAGGSDNNYDLTLIDGSFKVEKAPLVIRADDKTKIYGQNNPDLTMTFTGFVLDEDQSFIDVAPVITTEASRNSDAGEYDIIISGAADNNYYFTYRKGKLIIAKADQVISMSSIPDGLRTSQEHILDAVSSSGLPVTYETSDYGIGIVNNNTLEIIREGNLTITASQEGNNNWNPATTLSVPIVTYPAFDNIMSLFTPNNDGVNDVWYIPHIEDYGRITVLIYNRFGKKVYQSDSYMNDWDGTWNGDQLPSASYYYIISSQNMGTIKGVVNIVR